MVTSITVNNFNRGFYPIGGFGIPMMGYPIGMGFCRPAMPLFGMGYCNPMMGLGWYPAGTGFAIGAGIGTLAGAAIACPQFGKALAWPFEQLWKGTKYIWNNGIKPAAKWLWNGIKKGWNAFVGLFKKKKNKKAKES